MDLKTKKKHCLPYTYQLQINGLFSDKEIKTIPFTMSSRIVKSFEINLIKCVNDFYIENFKS